MNKETLAFTVSPSIIRHLIERQAGTLDKAILELITNGIDAGASRIDVEFHDEYRISVRDNGRGFRTREEVEKHFGDFGFDHDTEEERAMGRINGRFGMGRSQVYGFGRSSWRTHSFCMDVDIRSEKDLAFDLTCGLPDAVDGCHIDVELYEPMSTVDKERVRRTLKDHVKYAPSAIYVDQKRVNEDVSNIKWTAESERLMFLNKPTATYGLEVHNMGIYVNRFARSTIGVSGVIVSKLPHSFKVTMSRTDIHRSCEMWAEMLKLVKPFKERQRRKKQLTDDDRMGIARDWLYGELSDTTVMSRARVFKTVKGNWLTIRQLFNHANGLVAVNMGRGDRIAEAIHESHSMAVLACDFYDWIDASSAEKVITALNTMSRWAHGEWGADTFELGDYDAARKQFNGKLITVDKRKYTKLQKAQLASLNYVNGHIANGVKNGQRRISTGNKRRLTLGDADTALAWTDGRNYICIKRGFMNSCFEDGLDGILRLLSVVVHEQLHTESDAKETHDHPPEFFEAFENVMTSRALMQFSLAAQIVRRYDKERQKLGLTRSMHVAKTMDQVNEIEKLTNTEVPEASDEDSSDDE